MSRSSLLSLRGTKPFRVPASSLIQIGLGVLGLGLLNFGCDRLPDAREIQRQAPVLGVPDSQEVIRTKDRALSWLEYETLRQSLGKTITQEQVNAWVEIEVLMPQKFSSEVRARIRDWFLTNPSGAPPAELAELLKGAELKQWINQERQRVSLTWNRALIR